ncbi:MAG: SAM-dependent methyltransferase [Planctomycetes bacterium]|nr:SAM-dependent methyltransferase [Planctomycetota bacterium]
MEAPADYLLLDCGAGRRLESVGAWMFDRQAAQAFWPRALPESEWRKAACVHQRSDTGGGHWEFRGAEPGELNARHAGLLFRLKPTPFGHLGLFPEHAYTWQRLRALLETRAVQGKETEVLNLFAYTGGASLAAAAAGAKVCHVDASKAAVAWARNNAALNNLTERPIRWIEDDCNAFLAREARRGRRYDAVLLDPPSYGRGPRGEVFTLETQAMELLTAVRAVLAPDATVYFSCHTPGFTPLVMERLAQAAFGADCGAVGRELSTDCQSGGVLPSGVCVEALIP